MDEETFDIPLTPPPSIKATEVHYIHYRCANPKCAAEDVGKYFHEEVENNQIAPAINCWSCGGGRGLDISQMIQQRKGMLAYVPEPEPEPEPEPAAQPADPQQPN